MASSMIKDSVEKSAFGLPKGRYRLIGWDIDTSGKQLGDEICHIAGYHPDAKFSQYILPHKNLSPFVERLYKIRVITVSRYRMLKDLRSNKVLKTKSEISALTDFISWLENNKGDFDDGIILIHHEVKKIIPFMLLDALKRYNLYDRFAAVVKGFCNTCTIARIHCAKTLRSFSLKVLSRVLLDEEESDLSRSAAIRAKAYYTIVLRIQQGKDELQGLDTYSDVAGDTAASPTHVAEFVRQYSNSTEAEYKALEDLMGVIERQNSLRPIFKDLINSDWLSRIHAGRLRSKLAENNVDFDQLQNAWDNGGKNALIQVLRAIRINRKKDFANLLKILDCYFDPDKKPVNSNFCNRRKPMKEDELPPSSDDSSHQSEEF